MSEPALWVSAFVQRNGTWERLTGKLPPRPLPVGLTSDQNAKLGSEAVRALDVAPGERLVGVTLKLGTVEPGWLDDINRAVDMLSEHEETELPRWLGKLWRAAYRHARERLDSTLGR